MGLFNYPPFLFSLECLQVVTNGNENGMLACDFYRLVSFPNRGSE